MHQQQTAFENIVEKGEIARNEQFLLTQCFLLNQIIVPPFVHIFDIIGLFAAEFEEAKIAISRVNQCLNAMNQSIAVGYLDSFNGVYPVSCYDNPLPHNPDFYRPLRRRLWKTLREKMRKCW